MRISIYILLPICLLTQNLIAENGIALWKKEIKPLLEENCWKCHGADKIRAELVLTTREGVLKGGEVGPAVDLENPAASLMMKMVSYKDEDHQMPPIGKLPKNKIDALAKWIEIGLPFPKEDEIEPKIDHGHANTTQVNEITKSHWAFQEAHSTRGSKCYPNMIARSTGLSMPSLPNKICRLIHLRKTIP